jgi:hypothetical protein
LDVPFSKQNRTMMKNTTFACLAGIGLAAAVQAGMPVIETVPEISSGMWQWFIGGYAGRLTDLEEGMHGLQAGMEYHSSGERMSNTKSHK